MGKPTLKQIEGEGEIKDLTIYAHVNAPSGINTWAGMDLDGTPVGVDSCVDKGPMWVKGQEAAKMAAGKVEDKRRLG